MLTRFALFLSLGLASASFAIAADEEPAIITDAKAKLKDPTKPFVLFVTCKIKAGKEAEFEKAFLECAKATLAEKGAIRYEINRDTENPSTFVLYEKWKNLDGLRDHLKQAHTEKLLKQFPEWLDGAPSIKIYTAPGF